MKTLFLQFPFALWRKKNAVKKYYYTYNIYFIIYYVGDF